MGLRPEQQASLEVRRSLAAGAASGCLLDVFGPAHWLDAAAPNSARQNLRHEPHATDLIGGRRGNRPCAAHAGARSPSPV